VIGLIAHTWFEAMVRYTAELGYEISLNDAITDYSDQEIKIMCNGLPFANRPDLSADVPQRCLTSREPSRATPQQGTQSTGQIRCYLSP
jgi:hypothetical protein